MYAKIDFFEIIEMATLILLLLLIHTFSVFRKNLNASKPSEHPPQVEECLKVVLATEETTVVTQQFSHRPIKRKSTGHIMVITRYSDKEGSKSRQKIMRQCYEWLSVIRSIDNYHSVISLYNTLPPQNLTSR